MHEFELVCLQPVAGEAGSRNYLAPLLLAALNYESP